MNNNGLWTATDGRRMGTSIEFDNLDAMRTICGANDHNISYLEALTGLEILTQGNRLLLPCGDQYQVGLFRRLMDNLEQLCTDGKEYLGESEIFMEWQMLLNAVSGEVSVGDVAAGRVQEDIYAPEDVAIKLQNNKVISPKSPNQKELILSMQHARLTFAIGPAGTGKTFLAVAYALSQILSGTRQKIILTRPVVEAGESLGFLPGGVDEKITPYVRPLYDAMEWLLSPIMIHKLEENGAIEVAPLAYMRGRSLHNAVIILDEAQNTTPVQMKMFLTRLGDNSSAVVTGDISQVDLPYKVESGLVHASRILQGVEGISFVRLGTKDVVRSRLVQRIVDAYERDSKVTYEN